MPRPARPTSVLTRTACEGSPATTVEPTAVLRELSVRAENVLKMLALERRRATTPPQADGRLLILCFRNMTYRHLSNRPKLWPSNHRGNRQVGGIKREDFPGPAPRQPVTIGHVARIDIEVFGG